jgi:hypothetical protein
MSQAILPQSKTPKLIVVAAFDRGEDGDLGPAGEPIQFDSEERAVRKAKEIAGSHTGVVAWSREANPDIGEYGPPTTLYLSGEVPDME